MKSQCARCKTEKVFHVEYEPWIRGFIATCSDCYDGAPDSGYRVGTGDKKADAVADYNEQFE